MTDHRPVPALPEQRLRDMLGECVVQILLERGPVGSGFFIAPGIVLTCTHVVGARDRSVSPKAKINWRNEEFTGQVQPLQDARKATASGGLTTLDMGNKWPLPDLSVIELDNPYPDHPVVQLGEFTAIDRSRIYLAGYNYSYSGASFEYQPKNGRLDGIHGDGTLWQVSGMEIAEGMSGGPVLDLRTGEVCAIVKTSRGSGGSDGGWVITTATLQNKLSAIWRLNQNLQDPWREKWTYFKNELKKRDPYSILANEKIRKEFGKIAKNYRFDASDYGQLYRDVVGNQISGPTDPIENIYELVEEVSELYYDEKKSADLFPIGKLIYYIGYRGGIKQHRRVHRLGRSVARIYDQIDRYDSYKPEVNSTDHTPIFVVHLSRYSQRPDSHVNLTIWLYRSEEAAPDPIIRDSPPYEVATMDSEECELRDAVTKAFSENIRELHNTPQIEFVLPDYLLDKHVAKLMSGAKSRPLDLLCPVVIRFLDRDSWQINSWRARTDAFKSGRLPADNSPDWPPLWISCDDDRNDDELYSEFQSDASRAFVAMNSWYQQTPAHSVIKAAKDAGLPIILWQRKLCANSATASGARNCPFSAQDRACGQPRFAEQVSATLSGVAFRDLPKVIWKARHEAAKDRSDADSPGRQIAILWDDPSRCPWLTPTPANRYPGSAGS